MVNHIALGEIPDLQSSSVCRRHQEGFLEEVMGVTEVGHVKKEGSLPSRVHPLLLLSKLSPLDAFIQVSQF